MAPFSGVYAALITPFTDDGSAIDEGRLQAHIDHLLKAGIHGLLPGGSTGEFPALSNAERKQLTELCIKFSAGRAPVIVGTGALTSKECIELTEHAVKAGADGIMVVPPYYDPVNYEQAKELLREVKAVSPVPVFYYNLPSVSGLTLTPAQIASFKEVGVDYLKDTSGNGSALSELQFYRDHEIITFNGWDTLTFYGLAAGAQGTIWGAANIVPELAVELWNALAVEKNLDKGREIWRKIYPVCKFLESGPNYSSAVKTAMELKGIATGGPRKPFKLLEGELVTELASILTTAGLEVKKQS